MILPYPCGVFQRAELQAIDEPMTDSKRLHVDYHPDAILSNAAVDAGLGPAGGLIGLTRDKVQIWPPTPEPSG